MGARREAFDRLRERVKRNRFLAAYTRDLTSEDLQRLFTRDTIEAYRFFTRGIDPAAVKALPWYRRALAQTRVFVLAFTLKLSPARRAVYGIGVLAEIIGLLELMQGAFVWPRGTSWILIGFLLTNLLVLLEVADRLSLKNDLDIAREIQQEMLPHSPFIARGVSAYGRTRPANTVGGDFFDILEASDGRILVAVGDVAGKGSPAALLMALLLAIFRTLVDDTDDLGRLVERLNVQVARHAPVSRFITFFVASLDPASGRLRYVNAGHLPPIVWRRQAKRVERLAQGGVALGMFEQSTYQAADAMLADGDRLVLYSDGVTEAENADGQPFEEQGLEGVVRAYPAVSPQALADAVFRLVEQHTRDSRIMDDVTVMVVDRVGTPAGVP
jgi:sigma-B regulation protein RsbU (phosphoserine phosphatase)